MNNILEYKGYHTKIEYDYESRSLRGKIEGINDYVDFECDNIDNVEDEFHSAVDDYLDFCKEVGKTPEKEYKGSFNIRISPELHKKAAFRAYKDGCSLNAEIEKAITAYVDNDHFHTRELTESVRELTRTFQMNPTYYGSETSVIGNDIISMENIRHNVSAEVGVL